MKRLLTLLLSVLIYSTAMAQRQPQGLGTPGARLLVHSLIDAEDSIIGRKYKNNLAEDSMLSTDTSGRFKLKLPGGSDNTKWSINGNTGTTPGTHYIGTTDDQSLIFKANGIFSGKINTSTGNNYSTSFGYLSSSADILFGFNSAFGYNTQNANSSGVALSAFGANSLALNTTGSNNSGFGTSSLNNNTTGTNNTGIGNAALFLNTTADFNTALGAVSLRSTTTGSSNTSSGYQAMYHNTTGFRNTANGQTALDVLVTGRDNVGIGYNANVSGTGNDNSIAIGTNAIAVSKQFALTDSITRWKSQGLSKGGTTINYVLTDTTGNGDLSLQVATIVAPKITNGTSAPATTPGKVGDIYIDTSAKKLYFAAGTSSSADWIIAN